MTTIEISPERLTVVKHLASGKSVDVVATITRLPRATVVDIGAHHGYPDHDKLAKAAEMIQARLDRDATTLPEKSGAADPRETPVTGTSAGHVSTTLPRVISSPKPEPIDPALTKPDEIRVLLNTAKAHPSKRIQTAADRVFDHLDRLRALVREDEEKNSARRQAEAEKEAQRAEVKRLEEQLAAAKAKLRGNTAPKPPAAPRAAGTNTAGGLDDVRAKAATILNKHDVTSRTVREWAAGQDDIDCPQTGMLPLRVLEAYDAAHPIAEAS